MRFLPGKTARNSAYLLSARMFTALAGLAYLAIAARGLGVEALGILVLVQTYVWVMRDILSLKSSQTIVRFGAEYIACGQDALLEKLIRNSLVLDFYSALLAVSVGIVGARTFSSVVGIDSAILPWIYAYCSVLLLCFRSTAVGVLTLERRFGHLGTQLTIAPAIRLAGSLVCYFQGWGISAYFLVWIVGDAFAAAILMRFGWQTVHRQSPAQIRKSMATIAISLTRQESGYIRFLILTNLQMMVNQARANLPLLIVGSILGSSSASFFRVGSEISGVFRRIGQILADTSYPELARSRFAQGESSIRRITMKACLVATSFAVPLGAAAVLGTEPVLTLLGGSEFLNAVPMVEWLIIGGLLGLAIYAVEPAMLALGHPGRLLASNGVTTALLLLILPAAASAFGLLGVGVTVAAASLLLSLGLFLLFHIATKGE